MPDPLRRFERCARGPELVTTSASLAFYALISIPPMVLIAFWVTGLLARDSAVQGTVEELSRRVPDQLPVGTAVRGLLDVSAGAGPWTVVAALWPATAYGAALGRAFSWVVPRSEQRIRGWKGRLLVLAVVGVLPMLLASAVAALYVGPRVLGDHATLFAATPGAGALVALWILIAIVYGLYRRARREENGRVRTPQ